MADQTAPCGDELTRALRSLKDSGVDFRGPFLTSKGELIQVEDQLLKVAELLELLSRGQLNHEGICNFLLTNGGHLGPADHGLVLRQACSPQKPLPLWAAEWNEYGGAADE